MFDPDSIPSKRRRSWLGHLLLAGALGCASSHPSEPVTDVDFLWLVNAADEPVTFTIPEEKWGKLWRCTIDTAVGCIDPLDARIVEASEQVTLIGHSLVVLQQHE